MRRATRIALLAAIAAPALVGAPRALCADPDPPLPNAGDPTVPPQLAPPPATAAPPPTTSSSDSPEPRSPFGEVDALGAMARYAGRGGWTASVDASAAHERSGDAFGLVVGGRFALDGLGFVEVAVPAAYDHALGTAALGNVMVGVGILPAQDRITGIELRVAAATSPSSGAGMTAIETAAAPRVANPELFLASTTSAELVADARWREPVTWLQVEGGVAAWWQPAGYTTVLRATLAGGVAVAPWLDLTASVVARSFVLASAAHDNFVEALLVGAVVHGRYGELALRVELPIDEAARDAHEVLVGAELRAR